MASKRFNPRSREGSDEYSVMALYENGVSIHAPAKGATRCHWVFT